ncbi:MAG: TonB-dependent receptor [Bacteroidota bacterium]
MIKLKNYLILFLLISVSFGLNAQVKEGAVESAEITVEKDRKLVLPQVEKPRERPTTTKAEAHEAKQMLFDIPERKVSVSPAKFNPNAQVYEPNDTTVNVYENFVKAGFGNYGRVYLEGLVNTPASGLGSLGLNFKHNTASKGPKYGALSSQAVSEIGLNGKYVSDLFKLDGGLSFDRNDFNFYGYKDVPNREVKKDDIRQTLNQFSMKIGLENANRDASLDYSLHTGINFLKDRFEARELEWITNFNFTLPVTPNFYALVHSDAFVTQRSDSVNNNRNLIKVRPTFIIKNDLWAVTFGVNVANEKDTHLDVQNAINKNINRTKAFPLINIDYFISNGLYLFAGYEGDIYRNSLHTFLSENQWLTRKVNLLNTEKSMDIYGGIKGEIGAGLNYDVKLSYANYKDFYVFNNSKADTSKFEILYDNGTLNNFRINTNVYYKFNEIWRSSLKVETNTYAFEKLVNTYHLPKINATWSNTLAFKNKLFIGTDFYFLSKMNGYNPVSKKEIPLKSILDLNAKMNYQFSSHLAGFVYLNNLLGKTYQRYSYYPQQSLNFLVGLSYGFSTDDLF